MEDKILFKKDIFFYKNVFFDIKKIQNNIVPFFIGSSIETLYKSIIIR